MIPIECVVRGYFYGSFVDRYKKHLGHDIPAEFKPEIASKLPIPIFDPTTKSEEHDRPIEKQEAINSGILSESDYDYLQKISVSLYEKMSEIVEKAGFILADVKFEFGWDENRRIMLADSIGPDECRLWLKSNYRQGEIQESYDKQLLRDWLIKIGFKHKIDSLAKEGKKPVPLEIDIEVANELSRRYILAYERISGRKL
jgi:phosphoribosylaminoimidazole-succinocarboxamide synthase